MADLDELENVFDLLGAQLPDPFDRRDRRSDDLRERFHDDRPLMLVAVEGGTPVGGALAFRNPDGSATLRIAAVVERCRRRGVARRLVESVETAAGRLGVDRIGLGTDEAVDFWFHLGYQPRLLLQWADDPTRYDEESAAVLRGPLAGLRYRRSSFVGTPQLFVDLDEPRPDVRDLVDAMTTGCDVGFMMTKPISPGVASLPAMETAAAPPPSPGTLQCGN